MRIILATLCFLAVSVLAKAETNVKQYKAHMMSKTLENTLSKMYVFGVGEGFFWANIHAQSEGKPVLYCQPQKLALGMENYVNILDSEIKARSDRVTQTQLEEMSIALLLLQGLESTFPCKGK